MEQLSVSSLKLNLRRNTWFGIGIMAGIFLLSMTIVLEKQQQEVISGVRADANDIVARELPYFRQEVFMGQGVALHMRLDQLVSQWRKRHPGIELCAAMTSKLFASEGGKIQACAVAHDFQVGTFEERKIEVRAETLATLKFAVIRHSTFFDLFPPILIIATLLSILIASLTHRFLVYRTEQTILGPLLAKLSEDQRRAAIIETTQMIAHDMRKPFSTVKMTLDSLADSTIPEVRDLAKKIYPEVQASITTIDSMLQDILDIGKPVTFRATSLSVKELLHQVTNSLRRRYPQSTFAVSNDFHHQHNILVDGDQIRRVVSNILENAVQALAEKGSRIQISTREIDTGFSSQIEVVIQNDGPTIPANDIPKLFDAFFTSRRKGTGLGLAIAKKMVIAHGGRISCISDEESGTSFSFSLPVDLSTVDHGNSELVNCPQRAQESGESVARINESTRPSILLFDDQLLVHEIWGSVLKENAFDNVHHFSSWEAFVADDAFSLIENAVAFVDLNFAGSNFDGLQIAKQLKRFGVRKIYAITSEPEIARESGLFDAVFGKEVPENLEALVA